MKKWINIWVSIIFITLGSAVGFWVQSRGAKGVKKVLECFNDILPLKVLVRTESRSNEKERKASDHRHLRKID